MLAESLISLAASEILQAANSVESPAITRPYVEPVASAMGTARPAPTTIIITASTIGQAKVLRSIQIPNSMVGKGVHAFRSWFSVTPMYIMEASLLQMASMDRMATPITPFHCSWNCVSPTVLVFF